MDQFRNLSGDMGTLTFTRFPCSGGEFDSGFQKMSKSPQSAPPPPWGLTLICALILQQASVLQPKSGVTACQKSDIHVVMHAQQGLYSKTVGLGQPLSEGLYLRYYFLYIIQYSKEPKFMASFNHSTAVSYIQYVLYLTLSINCKINILLLD